MPSNPIDGIFFMLKFQILKQLEFKNLEFVFTKKPPNFLDGFT